MKKGFKGNGSMSVIRTDRVIEQLESRCVLSASMPHQEVMLTPAVERSARSSQTELLSSLAK